MTSFTTAVAPGALPYIGHAWQLARRPLAFLDSAASHGDLVEVRLGRLRAYLLVHPELAEHVLLNPDIFEKGGPMFDKNREVIGNGLITAPQEEHRRQRRLLQPSFGRARIAAYASLMGEQINTMTASWQPGKVIDAQEAMKELTMKVTARALFSTSIDDRTFTEFQTCLATLVKGTYLRAVSPAAVVEKLPASVNRRYTRAQTQLHRIVQDIIDERSRTPTVPNDILSTLLGLTEAPGNNTDGALNDQEIHDQVIGLLLAGAETTANLLAWVFHLLGQHREVYDRLCAELNSVLGCRPATVTDLPALSYTRQLITETLRLYPPSWFFTRITTADTELAGRWLPTGSTVIVSPYVLHRSPRLFPAPERFDPDRWLSQQQKDLPKGTLMPFGLGSRKCIGDQLALAEAQLAVATITSRWRLLPVPGAHVTPRPRAVLSPSRLPMTVQERGVL
jgi:cyclooctat-9-en-7-ol 5-monooxygenase